jgi:DNA-binding CsgD family transcriptional regulator
VSIIAQIFRFLRFASVHDFFSKEKVYGYMLLEAGESPYAPIVPLLRSYLRHTGWEVKACFEQISATTTTTTIRLTPLQIEVLKYIEKGNTNLEIADALTLKPNNVDGHLRRIFKKMQTNGRCESVAKAIRLGLI